MYGCRRAKQATFLNNSRAGEATDKLEGAKQATFLNNSRAGEATDKLEGPSMQPS